MIQCAEILPGITESYGAIRLEPGCFSGNRFIWEVFEGERNVGQAWLEIDFGRMIVSEFGIDSRGYGCDAMMSLIQVCENLGISRMEESTHPFNLRMTALFRRFEFNFSGFGGEGFLFTKDL